MDRTYGLQLWSIVNERPENLEYFNGKCIDMSLLTSSDAETLPVVSYPLRLVKTRDRFNPLATPANRSKRSRNRGDQLHYSALFVRQPMNIKGLA